MRFLHVLPLSDKILEAFLSWCTVRRILIKKMVNTSSGFGAQKNWFGPQYRCYTKGLESTLALASELSFFWPRMPIAEE